MDFDEADMAAIRGRATSAADQSIAGLTVDTAQEIVDFQFAAAHLLDKWLAGGMDAITAVQLLIGMASGAGLERIVDA